MTDENSLSFQLMLVGWAGRLLFYETGRGLYCWGGR